MHLLTCGSVYWLKPRLATSSLLHDEATAKSGEADPEIRAAGCEVTESIPHWLHGSLAFCCQSLILIRTQGRLTARRSDTILQRPRTAGGQARPAARGRCR